MESSGELTIGWCSKPVGQIMKKKPDVMIVLFLVFTLGAALSNITVGGPSQEALVESALMR